MKHIDIIVPVRNEEKNVAQLVKRIDENLSNNGASYRIIFVDDHSTDQTREIANSLMHDYPVVFLTKVGKRGKAFSIIEGSQFSNSEFLAFIDGDLQYSPEHISEMFKKCQEENVGVVVANRKDYKTTLVRRTGSRLNALIFGRIMLGLKCDVQSGLKVFRKEVISHIDMRFVKPWTIDMPLLISAKGLGYNIDSVDISFEERSEGLSKVNFLKTGLSIALCSVGLKLLKKNIYSLPAKNPTVSTLGSGIAYRNKRYITHSKLPHHISAIETTWLWQRLFLIFSLVLITFGLATNTYFTAVTLVALLSSLYFVDVVFNFFVLTKSLYFPPELYFPEEDILAIKDEDLPTYTILCPMYKEANVLPYFVQSILNLDWPREKLEVLLLLEEDDVESVEIARGMRLPKEFKILVVPHSFPKTKPKACNFGLHHATGDFTVIYDAEDRPERFQLKKAYLGFKKLDKEKNVVCLQAKLNYYDKNHNILTRLFTAEYSLWFDVILPGFQSIGTAIPLGGTSNHFKTSVLKNLDGWDAFNVTEDCDLGIRLFRKNYKTAIIDSTTLEEPNSRLRNWIRQRSRWIKGYMQTYLVHMRNPIDLVKSYGWHSFIFQLAIGARMYFILINPLLWFTTIAYFAFYRYVGPTIESLFPTIVFYMAAFALVVGNFLAFYSYMIGCAKRGHWDIVKYVFLVPIYWWLVSIASVIAFYQLFFKPHFWEKTKHGLINKKPSTPPNAQLVQKLNLDFKKKLSFVRNLPNFYTSTSMLFLFSMLASVFNYAVNFYLARRVSLETFGLIGLLGSFYFGFTIIWDALSRVVTTQEGEYFGKFKKQNFAIYSKLINRVFSLSIIAFFTWVLLTPFMSDILKVDSIYPILSFAPIWLVGLIYSIDYGFLNGGFRFIKVGILLVVESLSRLTFTIAIVEFFDPELVYLALPLSIISAFIASKVFVYYERKNVVIETHPEYLFPKKLFYSSLLVRFSTLSYLSIDVLLAKYLLSPSAAGNYVLVSTVGKLIFFTSGLFSQFLVPFVSKSIGEGRGGFKAFLSITALSSLAGALTYLSFGYFGWFTAPILLGSVVNPLSQFLVLSGFGVLCFSIASNIFGYYQIKGKNVYVLISLVLCVVQIVSLYLYGNNLDNFVKINAYVGILNLVLLLGLILLGEHIPTLINTTKDFFNLFTKLGGFEQYKKARRRVLFFNWRDTKHVWAGGAEVYIHEIAKRLVQEGDFVVLFCGNDLKSLRYEVIDGVHIIRRGGFYTVYVWAFLYYVFKFRGKFDVIIDSENGIPFFSPIFVKKPVIGLIHHVHQDFFKKHLVHPLAPLAMILESKVMPFVYKSCKMVTVSDSSKASMVDIGFKDSGNISIVNPGVNIHNLEGSQKSTIPTVSYLGRLKEYKSIDVAIKAFDLVRSQIPEAKFVIAGEGDNRYELEKLANELGASGQIEFRGKVSEEEKAQILSESWVMVQPSSNEGWGITVLEANSFGTPVVASSVPGLKDSVKNPHTGFLVKYGDVSDFSEKIQLLLENSELRVSMRNECIEWAKTHSWDYKSTRFSEIIEEVCKNA